MTQTTDLDTMTGPGAALDTAPAADAAPAADMATGAEVTTAVDATTPALGGLSLGTVPLEPLTPDAATPEEAASTPEGSPHGRRRAALSPSRAKDFQQCPLLFRFRAVDRLPEPPSAAAVKGSLVHAVLERLFDLPAAGRTEEAAQSLLDPEWSRLQAERPDVVSMFAGPEDLGAWLAQARSLLTQYFRMENPQRLEPAEREMLVETELASGVLLRGFVDRLDVAPNGAVRVVDYKTGKAPNPRFQDEALFQMRFYALMLWRLNGTVPARLQLVYLGNGRTLTHDPVEAELVALEKHLDRLWETISAAAATGDFQPRVSRLCDWCSFQSLCPKFGGEVPPMPPEGVEHLLTARAAPQ
ncbi:RecB family exonuclease [Georgenia subflava]|uniref:RecB family exonuclease n=1 Tax=Georgenia subflava TaxID=1622177 RepID=UPI00221E4415|nr:PD-(D/E)XK nuclease family protein [Georgenia subflava]